MTTATTADREFFTPPTIAKMFGVSCQKIIGWIERGELRASNLATSTHNRARWFVKRGDLEAFLEARAATPTPRPFRRRRQQPAEVTKYY